MRRTITGFSNPTVKFLRSLRDRKHRRREGVFLAEGLRLLTDARASGRIPQMLVMAERRAPHPLLAELETAVAAAGGEIVETTPAILGKITGKDNPQSVAGVFAEFDTALGLIERTAAPIWLVAQALRDPGNLGTMLRTGDAVGAGGLILLDECADPFSAEAVRASMGAVFTQAIARAPWDEFIAWLRGPCNAAPAQLVAASLRASRDYRAAPYTAPCFILVGNESQGLPAVYEAECDLTVTLPHARPRRQPQRRHRRRGAGLRGAGDAGEVSAARWQDVHVRAARGTPASQLKRPRSGHSIRPLRQASSSRLHEGRQGADILAGFTRCCGRSADELPNALVEARIDLAFPLVHVAEHSHRTLPHRGGGIAAEGAPEERTTLAQNPRAASLAGSSGSAPSMRLLSARHRSRYSSCENSGRIDHVFAPVGLLFGRVILVDHVLPGFCLIVHHLVSISDKRAKCRGIERLASVNAGQCGINECHRLGNLVCLADQSLALRSQKRGEVDRFAVEQPLDVAEAEPCLLERHDAVDALQIGGREPAPAGLRAQRRNEPRAPRRNAVRARSGRCGGRLHQWPANHPI